MVVADKLTQLGLTKSEALIYQTVLKIGVCTVKDISKESGFHRTNIYDLLEQLKEKGLITFFTEGKTSKYQVSDPHNLFEFLKEKEDLLESIYPEIIRMHKTGSEEISVEVFKGKEGMKASFRDHIRERKTIYGFGAKGQLRENLSVFAKQYNRDLKKYKIKYYAIYSENPPPYHTEIRFVPKQYGNPAATLIYGDKVQISIWEPSLLAIVIKSSLVAKMYKNHFDLLWKIAKRK
jgi:sugar-specific transcriptional regulator TrmB